MTDLPSTDVPLETYLSELSGNDWRVVSTQMSWFYRKPGRDPIKMSDATLKVLSEVETACKWAQLRAAVNARRKSIYRAKLTERKHRQKEKRRVYMREYMTMYRKRLSK